MYDRPFRWWVQSVMPLVFDDSLSYYEVLAKLTKYIEGLTGDVEQIEKVLETIEGINDITQFTEFLESIQRQIGDLANLQTDTKANLVSAINEVALKASIAYWKPPTGIPESDLSEEVKDKLNRAVSSTEYIINNVKLNPAPANNSPTELGLGTYTVPNGGIPWDTLSQDVKDRINAGDGSTGETGDYTELINKPQINGHTLNAGNNTSGSLGLGTYSKPSDGIPESDLSAEVQEKLNTSDGIADNQQTFVASRDYEAGELVYINGVLYKTKYRILAGTNMIPGNNIETTDISAEIERINNEIDALQSGSGPDSWNLSTTVHSSNSLDTVDFFEYFNCIGGENYNFIVEPVDPSIADGYTLNICKRDGSIAKTENVTSNIDYANRFRFTFTPTDSGEYFCKFHRYTNGSNMSAYKVTIEYTQSQGISELWAQVNAASQVEPRVGALEILVNQQQGELENIEGDVNDLNDEIDGYCDLDFSNIANVYMSTTTIGERVNFASGALSKTIKRITQVKHGYIYKISVKEGETLASTSGRRSLVVTDSDGIILQNDIYFLTAGQTDAIEFTAFDDGYLYLEVDANYESVSIEGSAIFQAIKLSENADYKVTYLAEMGRIIVVKESIRATRYATKHFELNAGTYHFHCDSVESTDTDSTLCLVNLGGGSATFTVNRGVAIDRDVVLPSNSRTQYFYASNNSNNSNNDNVTYNNVIISKPAYNLIGDALIDENSVWSD